MRTAAQTTPSGHVLPTHVSYMNEGIGPKKTAFIIVTVIGCIAILWPNVFYPMMFGGTAPKATMKEQRGAGGCCDVVLDRDLFLNATDAQDLGPQLYRKHYHLFTDEISLRQERPTHMHPESIYQAMRERGRAIPATPTVPIIDKKSNGPTPRIVEGRPGPIPGMRPPMGAGSIHQPQTKGNSMGFVMPLYTIGIVVFFAYTILKIAFKKPPPNAPYGPAPGNPNFRKEVFGAETDRHVEDLSSAKIGSNILQSRNASDLYNASLSATSAATNLSSSLKHHLNLPQLPTQQTIYNSTAISSTKTSALPKLSSKESEQLMEIEKLRKKLEDTEKAMARLIAEMSSDQYDAKDSSENTNLKNVSISSDGHTNEHEPANFSLINDKSENIEEKQRKDLQQRTRGDGADRSVAVLGIDVTASCEGGQKWTGRPPTPVFTSHTEHSNETEIPEPQSIYLEGSLPHDTQILVSDSETKAEEVYDSDLNGSAEEPAVVLSSKMTLSLINLDTNKALESDTESPLGDDIEIIGHDEK